MEFEQLWANAKFKNPATRENLELKSACQKVINTFLTSDRVRLICIDSTAFATETTFDIIYKINSTWESMQVNFSPDSWALERQIPSSIAFE